MKISNNRFNISLNVNENMSNKRLNLKNLDLSTLKQNSDGSTISQNTLRQNAAERVSNILNNRVNWLSSDKLNYFHRDAHELTMGSPIIDGKLVGKEFTTLVTASDYSSLYPYLNSKGLDKTLNTPVGQMEVFLDLDDDNDQYGVGKLDYMGQLINLDINQDGILNADDDFFDKLKLRGYNSNGEEMVLRLSDVYNVLDLTQFVNTQKNIKGNAVNGASLFRPEESYKRLDDS